MFGFTVSVKRKRKEVPFHKPARYCPCSRARCRDDCAWMFGDDTEEGGFRACGIMYMRRHLRQIAQGLGVQTSGRHA
jgi:hypothetical protein